MQASFLSGLLEGTIHNLGQILKYTRETGMCQRKSIEYKLGTVVRGNITQIEQDRSIDKMNYLYSFSVSCNCVCVYSQSWLKCQILSLLDRFWP